MAGLVYFKSLYRKIEDHQMALFRSNWSFIYIIPVTVTKKDITHFPKSFFQDFVFYVTVIKLIKCLLSNFTRSWGRKL